MNSHPVRVAMLVGLVVALPAVVCAHGDAFQKGIEARDRKDWPRAAAEMRRAIEADARESNQGIRVGAILWFGGAEYPYLPYFFLGEALLAQDDCAGAVDAWSRSEQQAVVAGDRLATIHRGYRTCEAKGVLPPGAYDPLVQRASQKIADAEVLFLRVSGLVSSNRVLLRQPADGPIERARKDLDASRSRLQAGMRSRKAADLGEAAVLADRGTEQLRATESAVHAAIDAATRVQRLLSQTAELIAAADAADREVTRSAVALTAPMIARRRAGSEKLARARELRDSGQRSQDAAAITDAMALARAALSVLVDVRGQASALARQSLEARIGDAARTAGNGVSAAARSLAEYDRRAAHRLEPPPAGSVSTRDALQKRLDAVRLRLGRARTDGSLVDLERVTRIAAEIGEDVAALTRALGRPSLEERGVPLALQEGAGLFLRGDYRQALEVLDAAVGWPDAPSLQLHVHLFRAAAHLAIFQRSGEVDRMHLDLAQAAMDRCKRIDPLFQPDPGVFTPRFIELYWRNRSPAAPSSRP